MPFLLPNEQRQSTEVITLATNPDTFGSNLLELYTELSSQLATAAQSDAPEHQKPPSINSPQWQYTWGMIYKISYDLL